MLPRPELPYYATTLPFAGYEIKYRPYTSKEEKLLMMAATSDDPADAINATHQILKLCVPDIEIEKLSAVDIEWIFLKLRSVSVSNVMDVILQGSCDNDSCPETFKKSVLIDNITVRGLEYIQQNFKKNKSGWIIPFTDNIGIVIQQIDNVNQSQNEDYVWDCLQMVYKDDEVVLKKDLQKEEFIDWMDEYPRIQKKKLEDFFDSTPTTYYKLEHECANCQKKYTVELTNLLDFFV